MIRSRASSGHEFHLRAFAFMLVLNVSSAAAALAQQQPLRPYAELRADAIIADPNAAQLGAGVQVPLGYYARLGIGLGGGVAREHEESMGTARGDAIVRFLLDPFRETPWALSAGAGVTVRYMDPDEWRAFLAVVLDLEGERVGPVSPAFQLGLGGGVRLGVVLRMSNRAYR